MNAFRTDLTPLLAACMTIGAHSIFPSAELVMPDEYEARWCEREAGTPVRAPIYWWAHYVSVYVESDEGVEIEVSAIVDLRPGSVDIDDYRCRVAPDGPEVEVPDEVLNDVRDQLVWVAEAVSR